MNLSNIKNISPLYSYWISNQTDEDEKDRLLIANMDSKAVYLFEKEPYKWENLFQAIARKIINVDLDSIRGMKVLLSTITASHRTKVLELFLKEGMFQEEIIKELSEIDTMGQPTKSNLVRFVSILFIIYTNPYGILVKRRKNHSYEVTGFIIHSLRQKISSFI